MAEEDRTLRNILEDLFKGRNAALRKFAKVRFTQYEMNLWWKQGAPLAAVSGRTKFYFSKRFLKGAKIQEVTNCELKEAFERLDHAVKDGCYGKCRRLVEELNEELGVQGLRTVTDVNRFLNWLTFSYRIEKDDFGNWMFDQYGLLILDFQNEQNLNEFWKKIQVLLKKGKMLSMQDICQIVLIERRATQIGEGK